MTKRRIIWSSDIKIKDWVSDRVEIMDGIGDCSACKKKNCENCEEFYTEVQRLNSSYLENEHENLNIQLPNRVIALADLGLWNGRKNGYKVLSNNLNSIFSIAEDYNEYYGDAYNIRATCHHHDGTNYILYRMLKPNIDVSWFENFMYTHNYKLTSQQISQYTNSLLPYVKKVYGW